MNRIIDRVELKATAQPESLTSSHSWDREDWVHRFHGDVFRFMVHLTRQREVAEDLTQQTFIKAWRSIAGFDGRASMRVWLHAIAYREYASWRRRHRLLAPLEAVLNHGRSHEDASDTRTLLTQALHELPQNQREAFLLNVSFDYSFDEAAEILGVSAGTLKSRAFYARKKLQESPLLQGLLEEGRS